MEPLRLVILARERLDDAHFRERFLENADRFALCVLGGAGDVADPPAEELADDPDRRGDDERQQREPPVHEEDDGHAADERQHLPEDLDDRLGDDSVDERRVARHVRHEVAGLALVEEGERERLQVGDDAHPEVEDHLLPGPRHDELAHAVDRRADQQDEDQEDHE